MAVTGDIDLTLQLMQVPTFIGIGAQRCGTTWLDAQLRKHPQVYMPGRRKEVHFFDLYFGRGLQWYQTFFPRNEIGPKCLAVGEITPRYLYDPAAAKRIRECLPEVRLIAMLRNPADRAYSQYGHSIAKTGHSDSFEKYLSDNPEVFERGLYHDQLERYVDEFSTGRLLVLIFEEVMADRERALRDVCRFIGVDESLLDTNGVKAKIGKSHRPRFASARRVASVLGRKMRDLDHDWVINIAKRIGISRLLGGDAPIPRFDPLTRRELLARYTDDICKMEALLGRDLSVWRNGSSLETGN